MPKRGDRKDNDKRLQRTITRNWIICGASLAAILILRFLFA